MKLTITSVQCEVSLCRRPVGAVGLTSEGNVSFLSIVSSMTHAQLKYVYIYSVVKFIVLYHMIERELCLRSMIESNEFTFCL